ncbi:hypothetical protein O181_035179 [Austropuccinia psidii MF-1]|uniref:Uncharacterized protein n=1 Tax=Austropuccinia psidii MF-1 TaxID=1389203 RepID=A0A9Q3D289_9BASI|nr:hypothetical protein [Austropuccinia psidii MF-1]
MDMILAEANQSQKDKGVDRATRSLSGHLQSQTEPIQQCTSRQGVSNPSRPLEKLHELLTDCEKVSGPSQYSQVTEWMVATDGKKERDDFNKRMEEQKPSITQTIPKTKASGHQQQCQHEKAATSSGQGKRKITSNKSIQPGLQNPKYLTRCHVTCVSEVQNYDGNSE